jgi:ABC-type branched-subunit amino acid transport system ATPase component
MLAWVEEARMSLRVQGISKTFGAFTAVRDVSFTA